MANENNGGLAELFDDLITGRKTVDQVKEELEGATMFLRAGKNYRALKFDGFARINGTAANCYVASDKIDSNGQAVASKPRVTKAASKKRGA